MSVYVYVCVCVCVCLTTGGCVKKGHSCSSLSPVIFSVFSLYVCIYTHIHMQIYIYTYINIYITYIYTLIYIFMLYLRTRESETRIERQGFKEKSLVLFFMYLQWPSARPSARSWECRQVNYEGSTGLLTCAITTAYNGLH